VLACRPARDQQVRDVHAGDEEQTADGAEQDEECQAHIGHEARGE
jgi:hypothetical protein